MRTALVLGVRGQDGAYLAKYLLSKGYIVFGTTRSHILHGFDNLGFLGINCKISLLVCDLEAAGTLGNIIEAISPDEIYNLAGQSSVGKSFFAPAETYSSIMSITCHLLDAVARFKEKKIRVFNASSGECFGDLGNRFAVESSELRPSSPYAMAKSSAHVLCNLYRRELGVHVCTGFLYNHESPLRPVNFVSKKIVKSVLRIHKGLREKLVLGDIDITRDWGAADEYVEAMWAMLQLDIPMDFVISTGNPRPLKDLLSVSFGCFGFNWQDFVVIDTALTRQGEASFSAGNPDKAASILGWKARKKLEEIIFGMLEFESSNGEI